MREYAKQAYSLSERTVEALLPTVVSVRAVTGFTHWSSDQGRDFFFSNRREDAREKTE